MRAGFPGIMSAGVGAPFLPTALSNLQLWLDAADTSASNIAESSNLVSQWNDKSGNGNNVTQGTGSAQPTTNVSTSNGKNVLNFDGGDSFDIPSGLFTVADGSNTVFVVSRRTSEDASQDLIFNFMTGATNKFLMLYSATGGQIDYRSNNTPLGSASNTGNTNTDFNIVRGRRSGTTQAIAVNGGAESTNTNGENISGIDDAFLGSLDGTTQFLTGSIAEVLMYDRSLSTAEITAVENYLTNKWLGFQAPTDLDGLQLWLDAADTATIADSSGSVSQWDDKSGLGNNAAQGTGANQPTTALDTINGKNVIDFDGTTDFFDLTSDVTLTADYSVFIVSNTDDTASDRFFLGDDGTSIKIGISNTGALFVRVLNAGSSDTTETFSSGNSILYITRNAANKVDQGFNGEALNRLYSDVAQSGTTTIGRIGVDNASLFWDGNIAEVIIYNRALTSAERSDVEKQLALKWGISI